MTTFVIQLGEMIQPGTEQAHWQSNGYYAGYTVNGPIIVPDIAEAMHMAQENARNIVGGDERLKASRIITSNQQ